LATVIGPLHVRRSILIQAPAGRVWQEFTAQERVRSWLDLGHTLHRFETHVGGLVEFSVEIDNERRFFGGRVLVFEPEQELTLESQWQPPHDWPVPTFWTFRLSALYDGTLVELFHHGFERLGADAADSLASYEWGWDLKHLQALRANAQAGQ